MVSVKELVSRYVFAEKKEEKETIAGMIRDVMSTSRRYPFAIAVDFDGTLCYSNYPEILAPREDIVLYVKTLQKEFGVRVVLWTCREYKELEQAIAWCKEQGIEFDSVNEDLPERRAYWGYSSRKVGTDEYWDDRAVFV